ncbi:MAG TPA: hypothetical protein VGG74_16900 [Kofleriaceae bacterium]
MTASGLAILLALAVPASAAGFFHHLADRLVARVAPHGPVLVAPVPVAVTWRPQRLAPSLDLGAPIVALAAGDLDGDGRAELYAVTSREVVAFAVTGNRVRELGRVAFAGDPPAHRPRDPVGAAVIDGTRLVASSSLYARTLDVHWRGKLLVADPGKPGIALCANEVAQLAPGRNYFGDGATANYGARCRDDLVSADGHPLRVRAELSLAGRLDVTVDTCDAVRAKCERTSEITYTHAGVGFEIVDLDRDGRPEVVFTGAGAPGEPDELRVVTVGEDEHKTRLRKSFNAGGVAAIAAGELERKGPVIVAAVRLEGSTRVDLWRMN